jgi:hypothetical protein
LERFPSSLVVARLFQIYEANQTIVVHPQSSEVRIFPRVVAEAPDELPLLTAESPWQVALLSSGSLSPASYPVAQRHACVALVRERLSNV